MTYEPLAERLRPRSLDDYIGQRHLVGKGAVIRRMIESGNISSFILWGPPGVGKTTLARIIAEQTQVPFYTLSAVTSGVKDVREVLDRCRADARSVFSKGRPILFIDEIHRFNKSQQDSLLGAVERGTVTLIGATTENPSFEVIRPLLSRAQVYVLNPLDREDLLQLLDHAIKTDKMFQGREIRIEQTEALLRFAGGDARKLLNILDLIMQSLQEGEPFVVTDDIVTDRLQQNPLAFDKGGEMHYDIISAFIKCIRGSDPDAAVYWLARLIAGGEDPKFIARRLCILAAEDIGLAYPQAIAITKACVDSALQLGLPEARIPLAEAAIMLATAPKSNSAVSAIISAMTDIQRGAMGNIPRHLQNVHADSAGSDPAPGYLYPHNFPDHYVKQRYLPETLGDKRFYEYGDNKTEQAAKRYWDLIKGK